MRGIAKSAAARILALAAVFMFALCVCIGAIGTQSAYAEQGEWNADHTHYYKGGDIMVTDGFYYVEQDKGWYYFDEYGFTEKGWIKLYWDDEIAYWYGDPAKYGMLKLGWQKIGGYWYYFAKESGISQDNKKSYGVGMMYDHGTAKVNNKWYYFGTSDSGAWGKLKDGWFSIIDDYGDKVWYYADPNNDDQLALGWKKISGKWYYFEPNDPGASYNENWYPIGVMHYGDIETIKGHEYYFAKNGVLQSGWIKDTDSEGSTIWYYADPDNGSRLVTGWKKIGGKWYYFEEDKYHGLYDYGVMYSDGINTVKDHDYYFAKGGAMQSGWIKEPQKYEYSDGSTESWNDWYYADPNNDSRLVKGWKKISGYWYYFGSSYKMYDNDTWNIDGKLYVFQRNGKLPNKEGWYDLYEEYTEADGTVVKESYWVYSSKSGIATTGWKKISGYWYYFSNWGYMQHDQWVSDSKGECYLLSNGKMAVSKLIDYNGYTYYVDGTGHMVKDAEVKIDGKYYYFDEEGRMIPG